jgi:rhodanese-related sulfurtransferase
MTPADVLDAIEVGTVIVDMRPPKPFAKGHMTGAVNIQFNRADLAERTELSVPKTVPLVVHAEPDAIAKVAVGLLAEAGFNVLGYLEGGLAAWKGAGHATEELPLIDVDTLEAKLGDYTVLDTRESWEYKHAHVPGAALLDWTEAWDQAESIEVDKPFAVICGDQVRSSFVASILQRHGKPASLVFGGMADWLEREYPVEKGLPG